MKCPRCASDRFQLRGFRFADLFWLPLLRYPVSCYDCRFRYRMLMWRVAGRKEIDEATAPLPAELQAVFQVLPPTAETVESVQKLAEAVAWQGPLAGELDSPPDLAEPSEPAPAKPEVEEDAPAPMCRLSFRGHRSDTGASGPAA